MDGIAVPDPRDRIEMVSALAAAIQTRWTEAQLEPCLGDEVRAGLAALEFLEAALDSYSPWSFGESTSVLDSRSAVNAE